MKLPQLIRSIALRRQQRRDGGYDMVPAYTVSEMIAYGEACARAALEEAVQVCGSKAVLWRMRVVPMLGIAAELDAAADAIRAIEVKQ